jgi:cell division protein FtsQ
VKGLSPKSGLLVTGMQNSRRESDILLRRPSRHTRLGMHPGAFPILALFITIAAVTFLLSPVFDMRETSVTGNLYYSDNEIIAIARVPFDKNMLLINSSGIVERLLDVARLEYAQVRKRYPSRIEITVSERKTTAFLPYGGFFVELDSKAMVIGMVEAITDPNIPIITGLEPTFVMLGRQIKPEAHSQIACKIGVLLAERAVPNISEVSVRDLLDIVIITNEGSRIMLGAADGIEERFELAVDILSGARAKKQAVKYIDVRITDRPVLGTK